MKKLFTIFAVFMMLLSAVLGTNISVYESLGDKDIGEIQ